MWKSTPERYGRVAIAIHWVSALLIIGLMIAGSRAAGIIDPDAKASILRIHVPIGLLVFALTLGRLGWWWFVDTKPIDPPGVPRLQSIAAKAVHGLLYVAVIGLAGSGIALLALSGAGSILFGGALGPLPDFWSFAPRYGHAAMAWLIAALLAVHVGAALYHQLILKDHLFSRIGVGR
jgi:cytochrome b561